MNSLSLTQHCGKRAVEVLEGDLHEAQSMKLDLALASDDGPLATLGIDMMSEKLNAARAALAEKAKGMEERDMSPELRRFLGNAGSC